VFHVASKRNMFMGNMIGGSGGHNIRFPYAQDFIFTFNYFHKPPKKANFRLHGEENSPTRYAVIGYNTHANTSGGGAYNINTVSSTFYNPIYDVIFEGNFLPHGHRQVNFGVVRASGRNNVMKVSNGRQPMFRIWQRGRKSGAQFDVDDIWIYNNTLVWTGNDTAKMVELREQDGGVFRGNARFIDNLLHVPGGDVEAFPTGSRFSQQGNAIITSGQSPLRSGSPGTNIEDYEVVSSSVDAGATDDWFEGQQGSGGGGDSPSQLAAPFLY